MPDIPGEKPHRRMIGFSAAPAEVDAVKAFARTHGLTFSGALHVSMLCTIEGLPAAEAVARVRALEAESE